MRRRPLIDVPPWALPALVAAVMVPIVVAFVTVGPFFGLLIGGAVGAAVVVTAIRFGSRPPGGGGRRRPG